MSGKSELIKIINYLLLTLTIIIIVFVFIKVITFQDVYKDHYDKMLNDINNNFEKSIYNKEMIDKELFESYGIIYYIVLNGEDHTNTNLISFSEVERIDEKVVYAYRVYSDPSENVHMWYAVKTYTNLEVLESVFSTFYFATIMLAFLLLVQLFFLHRRLIKPLEYLYEKLIMLQRFDFNKISSSDSKDNLNKEMQEFSVLLEKVLKDYRYNLHTARRFSENSMIELKKQYDYFRINVHDYKTPLLIIDMRLKKALEKYGDDKDLLSIKKNNLFVLNNISDLLKLDENSGLTKTLIYENIHLKSVIEEVIENHSFLLITNSLSMKIKIDEVYISFSRNILVLLLNNIFSNLYFYSKSGTEVIIEANQEEDDLILSVKNIKKTTTNNKLSTEVGLSSISELIRKYNGSVEWFDEGAEFEIRVIVNDCIVGENESRNN